MLHRRNAVAYDQKWGMTSPSRPSPLPEGLTPHPLAFYFPNSNVPGEHSAKLQEHTPRNSPKSNRLSPKLKRIVCKTTESTHAIIAHHVASNTSFIRELFRKTVVNSP